MSDFQFSPEAACRYGVDEAIFLHSMAFWIRKNQANGKNFQKGRYWTYNKQAALAEIFPFWTPRQIARITASCEEQGAILTDTLATDKSDRTKWYALTDEAAAFHFGTKTVTCNLPNGEMDGPQGVDDCGESDATNSPNGGTEREHPSHQTGDCIKGNSYLPDNKPPISPKGAVAQDVLFERFWKAYPRRTAKDKAKRAWKKLKPDMALCKVMAAALAVQKASEAWTHEDGKYIPHAATWLNGRRWEDEVEPQQAGQPPTVPPVPRQSRVVIQDGEEVVVFD